jgi:peptidoglycan/xylan/chitin deacetylase (PgdA/CDA1 family)
MTSTCLAVMYHYVRDTASSPFPAIRALPPAMFEQQLDWLQRDYQIIRLADLEAAMDGGASLPPNAALLTFDDGFVDHYEVVLPILGRRGLSGVFFLVQDASALVPKVVSVHKTHFLLARLGPDQFAREVIEACAPSLATSGHARDKVFGADRWEHADERALKDLLNYELPRATADRVLTTLFERHLGSETEFARELYVQDGMIREMAEAGMVLGCHTRSHPMLSRLDAGEQEAELHGGVAWIRGLTGQARVPFCYPWGGPRTYTQQTRAILERCGYSVAFNTVRRRVDVGRDGRWDLPRVDTRDLPPYTAGEPEAA